MLNRNRNRGEEIRRIVKCLSLHIESRGYHEACQCEGLSLSELGARRNIIFLAVVTMNRETLLVN